MSRVPLGGMTRIGQKHFQHMSNNIGHVGWEEKQKLTFNTGFY